MGNVLLLVAAAFLLYKCTGGDFGTDKFFGPPDTLPIERYEDMDVGVWFYYPDGDRADYLGQTRGAASCGDMAADHADFLQISHSAWSYVCCTHEGGSDCYRKIR